MQFLLCKSCFLPLPAHFKTMDKYSYISNAEVGYLDQLYQNYKKDPSVFEVGYLLRQEHWGKGLGTQICESMLALATALNPNKDVIGIIDPDNTASKRLLSKFGFKSFFVGIEDDIATEKLILKRTAAK